MTSFRLLSYVTFALLGLAACSDDDPKPDPKTDASVRDGSVSDADAGDGDDAGSAPTATKTVLDLSDVKTHPSNYEWFDFRPNVQKLILAGAAETEHIAILWYTVIDGGVALHYHSKTESVYVIDGTQTDAKGSYPMGTVYFNPPGSGHQIVDSSGFFLLAYASPPDFMNIDSIGEYTPVRIDTRDVELTETYPFEAAGGARTFAPELDRAGGMGALFIETNSTAAYDFEGNYLLVLGGSCVIDGKIYAPDMLVVTNDVAPEPFTLAAQQGETCLALGVSF